MILLLVAAVIALVAHFVGGRRLSARASRPGAGQHGRSCAADRR
jgi:hypothetical protein